MDGKVYRHDQIDFETNLAADEVIRIVEKFLETRDVAYEIDRQIVMYDTKSHITNEPVWYVDVIQVHLKKAGLLDCHDSIAVFDRLAHPVYMTNQVGRVVEEF